MTYVGDLTVVSSFSELYSNFSLFFPDCLISLTYLTIHKQSDEKLSLPILFVFEPCFIGELFLLEFNTFFFFFFFLAIWHSTYNEKTSYLSLNLCFQLSFFHFHLH